MGDGSAARGERRPGAPDGRTRRVVALSAALWAVGVAGMAALGFPATDLRVVALVALAVAVGQAMDFHFEAGGQAHTLTLSEAALVIALFVLPPGLVVAVCTAGSAVALVVRRQAPLRLAFNLGQIAAGALVAALVFRAVAGADRTLSPASVAGAYASAAAASLLGLTAVAIVIRLTEGARPRQHRLHEYLASLVVTAGTASLGILSVLAIRIEPTASVAVLALLGCGLLIGREFATLFRNNLHLDSLYRFTTVIGRSIELRALLAEILVEAGSLLNTREARVLLPGPLGDLGAGWWTVSPAPARLVRDGAGPPVEALASIVAPVPLRDTPLADVIGTGDGMVAPLRHDGGVVAYLVLSRHQTDTREMDGEDLRTFSALAGHAAGAVANSLLVAEVREQGLTDGLTGLPNRAALEAELGRELQRSGGPTGIGVLMVDLDRFRDINENLGHDVGDAVLAEVGRRLALGLGNRTLVTRFGGDAFAALLRVSACPDDVVGLGRAVQALLDTPVRVDDLSFDIAASVGAACSPDHGTTPGELIQHADAAMHEAKTGGAGRVHLYRPEHARNGQRRLRIAHELRGAIADREVGLHYQPKVDLRSGAVLGVEALARWRHPDLGPVPPGEFVELAEQTGAITPLTDLVLELVMEQISAWRRTGLHLPVAVNASARNLLDPTLPARVESLLQVHGVPAESIEIEITETDAVRDRQRTIDVMGRLRDLGVSLAIDDFGTGYSSMSHLRDLPVQQLKIDRSFVTGICSSEADEVIVSGMVSLGHELGLTIVAEGIEDEGTYHRLARLGCDGGQGYHMGRPMPGDEMTTWVRRWRTRPEVVGAMGSHRFSSERSGPMGAA